MSNIPKRRLGEGGPLVPAFGLGCMGMSAGYDTKNNNEGLLVLEKALKTGVTFWDTARIYGDNEEFISQILVPNRNKIFLCTKFGFDPKFGICGKREFVLKQCEESLSKLKTKHIDLYYQHRIDPNTPIEETMGALVELIKEGKIRNIGLSECSAETLRRAHAFHPIAAVQVEYSPWCTEIETNGLLATCRELGVSIVAYSPLGRGFLTGQIKTPEDLAADDWRRQVPRFQGENFYKNLEIVKQLEALAAKKGVPTSQFVLAWVLAQGEDFIIIPGTKRVKYFEENLGAVDVHLTEEEKAAVRKIIDSVEVVGTRYPAAMMGSLGN